MNKYKLSKRTLLLIVLSSIAVCASGCGGESDDSTAENTSVSTKAAASETVSESISADTAEAETETLRELGSGAESGASPAVLLTNNTGEEIKALSVMQGEDEFGENLLGDTAFGTGEIVYLYFDEAEDTSQEGSESEIPCAVKIVLSDDTEYVLHKFPVGDTESAVIEISDDTAYIIYTSLESGDEIITKDAEQKFASQESSTQETSQKSEETYVYYEETQIEYETVIVYEEKTQQAQEENIPAQTAAGENAPEQTEAAAADPNEGCLGDEGLFN